MRRLDNTIQAYDWGSPVAIAGLLGLPPPGTPQAELWVGAHPLAPSRVPGEGPLDALIARAPLALLGEAVTRRFGPRLPFLLKVLAAARPLSLQAHPSAERAREGFAREEALGIPRSAPHRCYRDDSHKPELLCALTPFHALCGFRPVERTHALLNALGLEPLDARLGADGLSGLFLWLTTLPPPARASLVEEVATACATQPPEAFLAECGWTVRLAAQYPGDFGVVVALLMNLVTLQPGQAVALEPGVLHAYLEGTGVEVMAASDNVLRGGLTSKHVDVAELLAVVRFEASVPPVAAPRGPVAVYPSPAAEFELTRVALAGDMVTLPRRGPDVVLVTDGGVTVNGEPLARGQSAFLAADEARELTLSGAGQVFRCTVGEG